jgi:MATE family multidrug resistance protein
MTAPAGALPPPTARRVLAIAVPVVFSNATVPLQGAIDTAIIGNLGSEAFLAAVGLGAVLFSFLFGIFNFLQMGSSGLSAQALGARDGARLNETLARAVLLAMGIAAVLLLLRGPLREAGLSFFEGSPEVKRLAAVYIDIRIWGAPAELANYALLGWFSGQALTRRLFAQQVFLAGTNVSLNVLFVFGFGYDIDGVAWATVVAVYAALGLGLWMARDRWQGMVPPGWRLRARAVLDPARLAALMRLNGDIFVRTMLLIGSFVWMTRLGSMLGDGTLAANVVLWQFFELSAYALDGFAIAAETLVGQAAGARDPRALRRAAVATSLWSGLLALGLSALLLVFGGWLIDLFTNVPAVRALARDYMIWAALTPAAGFAAFQLDGIFVGATGARAMRNGMILSVAVYVPASLVLSGLMGNHGVWLAIHLFLLVRAATLLARYPALERQVAAASSPH